MSKKVMKRSGVALPAVFMMHLAGLCGAAWIAFRHNIDALFYHYDGSYMLTDAMAQRGGHNGLLELWSNFEQGIGTIQFSVNLKLFPFFWPIYYTSDLDTIKVSIYLLITAALFTATFATSRLLSMPLGASLIAGWIICVLALPFIPGPIFYQILWVSPAAVLVTVAGPIVLALLLPIGRTGLGVDSLCGVGLFTLALYLLAASPTVVVLIAPGTAPYVAVALGVSVGRVELGRKLAVLASVAGVALALRWPWYLYGLFAFTAAHVSGHDFVSPYSDAKYVSLLFQGAGVGWLGPTLFMLAIIGAVVTCRGVDARLRSGAYTLLGILAAILLMRLVFALAANWILPPPIYVEIAWWPLYASYAAMAIARAVAVRMWIWPQRELPSLALPGSRELWLVVPILAVTLAAAYSRPPVVSPYRLPGSKPPIVDTLARRIAVRDGARFAGRVATLIPVDSTREAWVQQFERASKLRGATGNDHLSIDLWFYHIPTLFEYNQFSSPALHELRKLALVESQAPQQRNVTIYTYANTRILELLGVRFLITPTSMGPVGTERKAETIVGDETWRLSELPAANLASYTPTRIEKQADIRAAIGQVAAADFDPVTTVVVGDDMAGPLVPATRAMVYFSGEDLRVVATSPGRSLVVLPREYSRCLELRADPPTQISLHRVDGLLTGIFFEKSVDAVLSFRIGPLHNPGCRYLDFQDFTKSPPSATSPDASQNHARMIRLHG